ncbi:MAG: sigma-70 family RNA polymerase sigma factor [Bacteroidales bacterium]|nr:sigma-70 family RNA polymerase sigma factor [Bacteroidales bacterium]MCF8328483.1 sigma-70 family RNA polymerase sigma factor [Bacteroidales bacterium]
MAKQFDNLFIESLRQNDRATQRKLYETLFTPMFKVCKRYCNDHEEAMGVLNTGFYKVLTTIDCYKGKGAFEGWIRRIIVNTALDNIKSKKKYKEHIFLQERIDWEPQEENEYDFFEDEIETEKLYELIRSLPPVTGTVFNLYVFEECTHKEIAEKLGICQGTSKWHLANARKKLKDKVKNLTKQMIIH